MVGFEELSVDLIAKIQSVKVLITDVDGVLTDACIYYSERGEELKRFSMRDGMGVELLRKYLNTKIIIITGENSTIVSRRAEKLNITDVYLGVKDKASLVQKISKTLNLSLSYFTYIGDDVNDLEAMKMCGFKVVPADAVKETKLIADYITQTTGGNGVLREVADLLLYVNNIKFTSIIN